MLVLSELRKCYGELVALDSLDLELEEGEVFGLLGPNGAGKSTAVALCVGLVRPDSGQVQLRGHGDPRARAVRANIGIAPQSLAIYERMTGEENLRFFGGLCGLSGTTLDERVRWALDFVGLAERKDDRAKTYSGGMARRLNLASAILHDPTLLLLDEPTVGVDPQSRNLLLENIAKLRSRGRTILYTTHYMEEAERLCDRVGIIDHGKLLAVGRVDELVAEHGGKPELEVEIDGTTRRIETDDPLATLRDLSATHELERFGLRRATLEDVFLNLTGRSLRD